MVLIAYSLFTYKQNFLQFNSLGITVFCIFYILYAILGFLNLINEQKIIFLEKSRFFWVNVAWLIYSSGVSFIFLFEQYYFVKQMKILATMWVLVCLLNAFKYICLAILIRGNKE